MDWDVILVKALDNYNIYVELKNGKKGIFNMTPYLNFGVFKELKSIDYFREVGIVFGAVTWPHEQDIEPETLLAGLQPIK